MTLGGADPYGRAGKLAKFDLDRPTFHVGTHDDAWSDLRALALRSESRIVTLSEELGRSRADFESTSARYSELAGEIPADLADLSGQLCRILNAAAVEADEILAEARGHANVVRLEAEEHAARILAEAQLEYDSASALRAEAEAQSNQARDEIARLREQAALHAADMVKEANDTAEEMLARVHRDIDAQLALARIKLEELVQVRASIAAQVRNFYDRFNQLDGSVSPTDTGRSVFLVTDSSPREHTRGSHAAPEVDLTQKALRSIG